MTIDPSKTAIILIEYQNEFVTEGGKLHDAVKENMQKTNMLVNTAALVESARAKGIKIMHAPILFSRDYREMQYLPYGILKNVKDGKCFIQGEWGGDFCTEVSPKPEDTVVKGKSGLCGFATTNLDFLLRKNGVENIALCGFLTNCCVESTMRAGYEKGYQVYTMTDCTAATSNEEYEASISKTYPMFSKPMTSNDFLALVQ